MFLINNIHENKTFEVKPFNEFKLCIPKEYARGESNKQVTPDEAEEIDHYELYVEKQIGSERNRRDTYVYLKLPKSGTMVPIILYMDGGVDFDPNYHKQIIRELDALDRRIILGFCLKNETLLRFASYGEDDKFEYTIRKNAASYNSTKSPKRLDTGSRNRDYTNLYRKTLRPYEEMGIFSSVQFI